jgi:release factor glutamine methyltransferase
MLSPPWKEDDRPAEAPAPLAPSRSIAEWIRDATASLEESGVDDVRRNVEWMLESILGCTRAALYAYPERTLTQEQASDLTGMLDRRRSREPLQHILGHTDFYGLRFAVTPDVLIPRPETEQVVEAVLRLIDNGQAAHVLDIGTGSGCIAATVKYHRPGARVVACDVSTAALVVARQNAKALGVEVEFVDADVLAPDFAERVGHDFEIIVSNPPYVTAGEADALEAEVRDYEPPAALYCEDDPLRFYRALAEVAFVSLAPDGWLVVEAHADHAAAVAALFAAAGLADVALARDLSGRPRVVSARRPAARR